MVPREIVPKTGLLRDSQYKVLNVALKEIETKIPLTISELNTMNTPKVIGYQSSQQQTTESSDKVYFIRLIDWLMTFFTFFKFFIHLFEIMSKLFFTNNIFVLQSLAIC